jgi:hypothetical protein
MDKTPKEYKSLAEMPPQLLASNVVGSLIEAKGVINTWQVILEHLVTTLTKEVISHVTPQIRAAASDETIAMCVKAIQRLQENYSLEHGRESYGSVEYPEGGLEFLQTCDDCIELIRTAVSIAPLPSSHVCVPVEPTQEMIAAGRVMDETLIGDHPKLIYKAMLAAAKEAK